LTTLGMIFFNMGASVVSTPGGVPAEAFSENTALVIMKRLKRENRTILFITKILRQNR
jgi:hypothetical protein